MRLNKKEASVSNKKTTGKEKREEKKYSKLFFISKVKWWGGKKIATRTNHTSLAKLKLKITKFGGGRVLPPTH